VVEQATLTAAARTAPPPPPEGEPPSISPAAAAQLLPSPGLALVPLAPGSAAPSPRIHPSAPQPAGTLLLDAAPPQASARPAAAASFHGGSGAAAPSPDTGRPSWGATGDGPLREGPRPPSDMSPPPRAAAAPLHFKSPPGTGDVRSRPPAAGDGTLFLPSSWQWAGATGGGGGGGAGTSFSLGLGGHSPPADRRSRPAMATGTRCPPAGNTPPPLPPPAAAAAAGYDPYEDVVSFAGLAAAVEFGYDIMTAGRT
jgi:hypothetical protein